MASIFILMVDMNKKIIFSLFTLIFFVQVLNSMDPIVVLQIEEEEITLTDERSFNRLRNAMDTLNIDKLRELLKERLPQKRVNVNCISSNSETPISFALEQLGHYLRLSDSDYSRKNMEFLIQLNGPFNEIRRECIAPFDLEINFVEPQNIWRLEKFLSHNILSKACLESEKQEIKIIVSKELARKNQFCIEIRFFIMAIELLLEHGGDKELALQYLKESLYLRICNGLNTSNLDYVIIKSIIDLTLWHIIIEAYERINQQEISPERISPRKSRRQRTPKRKRKRGLIQSDTEDDD